jgi:hypothetical protein
MSRARTAAVALTLLTTAGVTALLLAADWQDRFPHEDHTGLFPLCIGCHVGIPTGDRSEYYPDPDNCASCHDGVREPAVAWHGPTPRVTNVRFEHATHDARIAAEGSPELDCAACHIQPGAGRMQVEPPIPDRCFDCHEHAATDHFVDGACTTCHAPLAETQFERARVAALPRPATHETDDFLANAHGELAVASPAVCATCHVREQCTSCHVTAATASPVEQVPSAAGAIDVPLIPARYPAPESHLDPEWERQHGGVASAASCGTCHTRDSCTTCHVPPGPTVVSQLASARHAAAPGALVQRTRPESHSSTFFATMHGPLAATRPPSCAICHEQRSFCATCHEPGGTAAATGPGASGSVTRQSASAKLVQAGHVPPVAGTEPRNDPAPIDTPPAPPDQRQPPTQPQARTLNARGFHPVNFVLRHSAEAYGRRLECSNCHSSQLFCRNCHESAGAVGTGRLGPGFHDAEPVWLLRHGQAARQTLETCTACHTQRDCMQCHSTLGAFRVNPHGPNFDARRAERTNPQICRKCHF